MPENTRSTGSVVAPKETAPPKCSDANGKDALVFTIDPEQREALLSSDPDHFSSCFRDFIENVKGAFDKEGVVVVRGLFDEDNLQKLEQDAQAVVDAGRSGSHFSSLKFGPVFSNSAFRHAALSSAIPRFIGTVLLGIGIGNTSHGSSLRVLKDAFLCKGGEKKCCGWHVDDSGFWPTNAKSTPGVNAWIALDDIPAKFGGGLAVSPRSHRAPWRHDAYRAIGSTQIFPEEGLVPGTPLYQEIIGKGYGKTCDMEVNAPELAVVIDSTKKVFDYRKGDVLFHTRWIFHRSDPITDEGLDFFRKINKDPEFKRYSIRYELGSSQLLRGISGEFAVLMNPKNSGKTLDEVCEGGDPWFPKAWPQVSDEEARQMDLLIKDKFPLAEKKRIEMFQELAKHRVKD